MDRRHFLKTIPALTIPAFLNGFDLNAFAPDPVWGDAVNTTDTDHVLVLIQLNGGNDGLNTLIPLDQYSNLSAARSNILIPDTQVLTLNGVANTGLHPAMTGMRDLYNDGKMAIIQSVGYPNPDFSHFRATDIWLTAADSNQILDSGWAARYLNSEYPNYPVGYPNSTMPDPLAIQISSSLSPVFVFNSSMGMSITDPNSFYNMVNGVQDPAPNTFAGKELSFIRGAMQQTQTYFGVINAAAANVPTQNPYPTGNNLADKLKIIAKLIAGGLKTRIYMVDIGGFDTHDDQTDATDTTIGEHADLLKTLSDAVAAFVADCAFLGIADRVIGMTFSEFGRRIVSNDSIGTDHGAAAPMFIFGTKVQSGVLGTNPTISATVSPSDNIPMQYDFRSVYASVLQDWFCVPSNEVSNILLQNFQTLPLLQATCSTSSIHELNQQAGRQLLSNRPNPFTNSTYIDFETFGGYTLVQVFDYQGKMIATLAEGQYQKGKYELWWNAEGLAAGNYFIRLQNEGVQQIRPIVKVEE
ncbi:MAG: DUF1501 domain-containing protein [Bacteroidia bacterium]